MQRIRLVDDESSLVAAWEDVVIQIFTGSIELESFQALAAAREQVLAEHPRGFYSLTIAAGGIPMPGADVRISAAHQARQFRDRILGAVVVLEGDGFWLSTARSILTAIQMLGRGRAVAWKVRSAIDDGAVALALEADRGEAWAMQVESVVHRMRAHQAGARAITA